MSKPAESESLPNTADIKNLLQRAATIEDEIDEKKLERKDLNAEIKAASIDLKAFNVALRIKRKPPEKEFTDTVNGYLESDGQMAFFI